MSEFDLATARPVLEGYDGQDEDPQPFDLASARPVSVIGANNATGWDYYQNHGIDDASLPDLTKEILDYDVAGPDEISQDRSMVDKVVGRIMHNVREIATGEAEFLKAAPLLPDTNPYFQSFLSGTARMAASTYRIPATLYDMSKLPENIVYEFGGFPELEKKSPDLIFNNFISKYYDRVTDTNDYIKRTWTSKGENLWSLIGKGDKEGAAKYMAHQVVTNAPQQIILMAMMASGAGEAGLVFMGLQQSAQELQQSREKGDPHAMATLNAIMSGSIEAGMERVGTFGLMKSWETAIVKSMGKAGAKELFASMVKQIGITVAGEGNEEFWTSLGQDFSRYITGIDKDALKGTWGRAFEAGAIGGVSGFGVVAPGGIAQGARSMDVRRYNISAQKQYNGNVEAAFREGGVLTALSVIQEDPKLARTALGRGIISVANNAAMQYEGTDENFIEAGALDSYNEQDLQERLFNLSGALWRQIKAVPKFKMEATPSEGGKVELNIELPKDKQFGQYKLREDEFESEAFSPVVYVNPNKLKGEQFFVDNKIVEQKKKAILAGEKIKPIVVKNGKVIDGYHTADALTQLGYKEIPAVFVETYDKEYKETTKDHKEHPSVVSKLSPTEGGKVDYKKINVGDSIGNLKVMKGLSNQQAIANTLGEHTLLDGTRVVSIGEFDSKITPTMADKDRVADLIKQISKSGEIKPIIVAIENGDKYVLEGQHRFEALKQMGYKEIPAQVALSKLSPTEGGKVVDVSKMTQDEFIKSVKTTDRTAEDIAFGKEGMDGLKIAMQQDGKIYAYELGQDNVYNHADIFMKHGLSEGKAISGFVDSSGDFIYQYPKEAYFILKKSKLSSTNDISQGESKEGIKAEGSAIIREYLPELAPYVKRVDVLFTPEGRRAVGMYLRSQGITIAEGADESVYAHETAHAFFDLFTTATEKQDLLQEVMRNYGLTSTIEAEERLADDFEDYLKTYAQTKAAGKPVTQKIRAFYSKMKLMLDKFVKALSGEGKAQSFYDAITNRRRSVVDRVTGEARFKPSARRTLTGEVAASGGIDPDSVRRDHDLKIMKENGLPSYVLRKGGLHYQKMAQELVSRGLLVVPEEYDMKPGDYLLEVLSDKKLNSIAEKSDAALEKEYRTQLEKGAEEYVGSDVSFDVKDMEKELAAEYDARIKELYDAANVNSKVRQNQVKKIVREVTGQTKIGDLIKEADALKATMKAEVRAAKAGYRAGVQVGMEQQRLANDEADLRQRARDEARDEINDIVSDINKLPTKNLPLEYKDKIEEIKSGFDLKKRTQGTLAKRESMKAFVEQSMADGDPINIPIEQLEMLEKTTLNDMTLNDLRDVHQTIMRLYHLGKLKNKLIVAQDDRSFDQIRSEAIETITKGKGLSEDETFIKHLKETNKDLAEKSVDAIKTYIALNMRPELMINSLDSFDLKGPSTRIVWDTAWNAEINHIIGMDQIMTRIKAMHSDLDLRDIVQGKHNIGRFRGMTKDNAMFIYANSFNENNLAHLYGSGITDQDLADIKDFLSPEEMAAVDQMIDYYDNEQWPEIEKVYSDLEGVHLGRQKKYFPVDRLEDISFEKEIEMYLMEKVNVKRAGVAKGFTENRVTSDKGFSEFSYLGTILRNAAKVQKYISSAKAIRDINKYINNKEIKKAIRENYGETYHKVLDKWLKDFSYNTPGSKAPIDNISRWVRTNYGVSVLGLNIVTMLKQPVSFLQGMEAAGKGTSMKALGQFITDPQGIMEFVDSRSTIVKHRAFTQERELAEIVKQRGVVAQLGGTEIYQTIREKSMMPILMADRVTVVCIWKGAYDNAINNGLSEPDSIREADRVVRRTQPMGGTMHLPDFFRGPEYQKLFTMFRNQPNQNFNLILESWMKKQEGKIPTGKFASEMAFYLLIPSFIMALINRKRLPEAEEFAKDMLNQALGGTFLLGHLTNFLSSGYMGGITPLDSYISDAMYAMTASKPETRIRSAMKLASKISGLPYLGVERLVTGNLLGGKRKKAATGGGRRRKPIKRRKINRKKIRRIRPGRIGGNMRSIGSTLFPGIPPAGAQEK